MLKATLAQPDGRTLLTIGLSYGNLNKFLAQPGDTYIKIDGKEMGLPIDVLIFSGKTEAEMQMAIGAFIGPETKVHIDPKLKS